MTLTDGTRMVYSQEPDCCDVGGIDQRISLTITDGGGGAYIVMRTRRWAIDSETDLDSLVTAIRAALAEAAKVK